MIKYILCIKLYFALILWKKKPLSRIPFIVFHIFITFCLYRFFIIIYVIRVVIKIMSCPKSLFLILVRWILYCICHWGFELWRFACWGLENGWWRWFCLLIFGINGFIWVGKSFVIFGNMQERETFIFIDFWVKVLVSLN
jgi:hypothetical protein